MSGTTENASQKTRIRVKVDPVACDAYGYCTELLPELVALDEWGYPVVGSEPVPAHLVELAVRAARDCPRQAFLSEEIAH